MLMLDVADFTNAETARERSRARQDVVDHHLTRPGLRSVSEQMKNAAVVKSDRIDNGQAQEDLGMFDSICNIVAPAVLRCANSM